MLLDALDELLLETACADISIQEIAVRAKLNRATVYLHYPDKDALLKALTGIRFRKLLERRSIVYNRCDGASRASRSAFATIWPIACRA